MLHYNATNQHTQYIPAEDPRGGGANRLCPVSDVYVEEKRQRVIFYGCKFTVILCKFNLYHTCMKLLVYFLVPLLAQPHRLSDGRALTRSQRLTLANSNVFVCNSKRLLVLSCIISPPLSFSLSFVFILILSKSCLLLPQTYLTSPCIGPDYSHYERRLWFTSKSLRIFVRFVSVYCNQETLKSSSMSALCCL